MWRTIAEWLPCFHPCAERAEIEREAAVAADRLRQVREEYERTLRHTRMAQLRSLTATEQARHALEELTRRMEGE